MKSNFFYLFFSTALISGVILLMAFTSNHDTDELYSILKQMPESEILSFQTYDHSGQVVHPDICYTPLQKHKFHLALTPYPTYNDSLENPCIYAADDGIHFFEEEKISNPVVKPINTFLKNKHHNNDPDLSFIHNKFYLIYQQTMKPDSQSILCKTSKDGLQWEQDISFQLNFNLLKNEPLTLSPSLIEKENIFYLYFVQYNKNKKNTVEFLQTRQLTHWNKDSVTKAKIRVRKKFTPWHIDIFKKEDEDIYYMLLNGYEGNDPVWQEKIKNKYVLYLAKSKNMTKWKIEKKILDCSDIPDANCQFAYRSTGLAVKDLMVIWYSYTTMDDEWKIGIKKINLK